MSIGPYQLVLVFVVATLQGVLGVSILACFNSLSPGQYIENGPYRFVMGNDCTLRLYNGSLVLWQSQPQGNETGCTANLVGGGDLYIENNLNAITWSSNSIQTNGNYLRLDDKGIVSIKSFKGDVLWTATVDPTSAQTQAPPPPPATSQVWEVARGVIYMVPGYRLVNTPLQVGQFILQLNRSCFLELLDGNNLLWASDLGGTAGDGNCYLALQDNGTLQIISGDGAVAWNSGYGGPPSVDSYVLYLDGDGAVSVFDSLLLNHAVWIGFAPPNWKSKAWIAALGIAIAVIVAIFVLVVILWVSAVYFGYVPGFVDPAAKVLAKRLQTNGGRCQPLSLSKVRQATNGFQKKLGEGGFGKVYYGRLSDGQEVAVKVLSATSLQGKQEFFNEIDLLSVAQHKYVVSLIGYCLAWKKQILVYEYVSGGDLQESLRGESVQFNPLSWKERTSIILQIAEGIEYLHHGCPRSIIHRDLKSSNILLTDKGTVKVGDFGLSKLIGDESNATHITTVVKGTFGYLDPEYSVTGNLTEKSDVYAFGVILMEIITGQALTDHEKVFIGARVRQALKSGQVDSLADPKMGGIYSVPEFRELANLSQWCVKTHSYDRPSMSKVVQELRDIGLVQMGPFKAVAKEVDARDQAELPIHS